MHQTFQRNFAFFCCALGFVLFIIKDVFCSVSCSTGWIPNHDLKKCIKFYGESLTFNDSRESCRKENANLIVTNSCKQNSLLADDLTTRTESYWLGVIQYNLSEPFLNVEDQLIIQFSNWHPHHPDVSPNADNEEQACGVINSPWIAKGYWVDDLCSHKHGRICCREPETVCDGEKYGTRCSLTCSKNCAGPKKRCDPKTGTCLKGCASGFQGPRCDKECVDDTYGLNCQHKCSHHCVGDHHKCDPVTGNCAFGCDNGFLAPKCVKPCPMGKYGQKCRFNCSQNCAGRLKLCNSTDGVCTSGCILGYSGGLCLLVTREPLVDFNLMMVTAICAASTLFCLLVAVHIFAPQVLVLHHGEDYYESDHDEHAESDSSHDSSDDS